MKIGFILFERYWQRRNIGSSRIRGRWVIEKLNEMPGIEAEEFKQGAKYDVIVFQKCYWKEMARAFKGIKILDICDPDWLDGVEIVNFTNEMDAITVPTQCLKEEMETFAKCPVYVIPDRVKLDNLPEPKHHEGIAKEACWFGYSHNLEILEMIPHKLKKLGLALRVISDGDYKDGLIRVINNRWEEATVNKNIQYSDIMVLPQSNYGRNCYKSNNKVVQSWALGMPVATNPQELERFMDAGERNKEAELRLKEVKEKYDVRLSAEELVNIIKTAKNNRGSGAREAGKSHNKEMA